MKLALAYVGILILAFIGNFSVPAHVASYAALGWWIGAVQDRG